MSFIDRYTVYKGREPFLEVPPEFALPAMRSKLEEVQRESAEDHVGGVLRRVVEWSWSRSFKFLHRLEPFHRERLPVPQAGGGRVEPGPAPGPNFKEYGRDEHGRLVIARLSGVDDYAEVWASPGLGVVLHAAPRQPGAPVNPFGPRGRTVVGVRRAQWSGDRMTASAEFEVAGARAQHLVYEYRYRPDGITEIRGETRATIDGEHWGEPRRELWLVERAPRRRATVRAMWVVAAEEPTMSAAEVDDLEQAVVERLMRLIPELITRIGVAEVVYFLMLSWTRGFSVQICPATERTRARLLGRRPYKPLDAYLHYNDGGINCDLDDWGMSSLLEDGELLELELFRRREDSRRDAIRTAVARRLNDLDWTGRMQTSEDFVVGALSETGSRKTRVAHFRASVDPQRFAALETREHQLAEQLETQRSEERVIKRHEALAALRQAVRDAGVEPAAAARSGQAGRRAWDAFLAFAAAPIVGLDPFADEDAILVEQSATATGGFTLSFARQLTKTDRSGEHAGYDVIYANLAFDPQPDLVEIAEINRSASRTDLEDARAIPNELPALAYVLDRDPQPTSIEIAQTRI